MVHDVPLWVQAEPAVVPPSAVVYAVAVNDVAAGVGEFAFPADHVTTSDPLAAPTVTIVGADG